MKKKWVYNSIPPNDKVAHLCSAINVNPTLASLLIQRQIDTFEEAKRFFRPSLNELHDPFLMKDMDIAIKRIMVAMERGEKILIFGDYDVDGTTAVAMVFGFFRDMYPLLDFYIPDRYKEGYGISSQSIEWAAENGFSLIISLDCGIKSNEHIKKARSLNIDYIICDHHQPGSDLPEATAVLDPKRQDCEYPYKELSGCGVGFKLLHAYCIYNNIEVATLYPYLDLLAISIAADIVPITGENRILAYHGIICINNNCRPGIKALIEVAGFKKEMNVSDVVFSIGPRINAAGRIAHARTAVMLMLSRSLEEATGYAEKLNEKNTIRKDFDAAITSEAIAMIEKNNLVSNFKSTVLFKEDWHKGVIGIVASRCIEKYYRPTIIFTESNNMATGSARSVDGFDVYTAISQCAHLLEQYGGHKYAAGLTLKKENIEEFRKAFENAVSESITEDQMNPRIYVDYILKLDQINYKFYNIIKQMAPFGPGNMQPVFVTENVSDDGRGRILKEMHLKLFLTQNDGVVKEAIGFGMADKYPAIAEGKKFNICYTICENNYKGEKSLQLIIKDLEVIDC